MSPITHLLTGWLVANGTTQLSRRERTVVTVAAVVADLDGMGIIVDSVTGTTAWYEDYHHTLGHNLLMGFLVMGCGLMLATNKWLTGILTLISFHLHLVCDLVGSRGPDGYQWPINYLWPFLAEGQWTWAGQWELNAWPNFLITGICLVATFLLARHRGFSPLEMFSVSADRAFIATLRQRFPLRG